MTSQQTANEALAIYQAHRDSPRAILESLLAEYFGPTSNEYEEIQSCVHEIFTAPQPIFLSDLPERLSSAF